MIIVYSKIESFNDLLKIFKVSKHMWLDVNEVEKAKMAETEYEQLYKLTRSRMKARYPRFPNWRE